MGWFNPKFFIPFYWEMSVAKAIGESYKKGKQDENYSQAVYDQGPGGFSQQEILVALAVIAILIVVYIRK